MKSTKKIMGITTCIATMLAAMPLSVSAEGEEFVYGTMNIPYADFYEAELADSVNAYEVDAVSSATTTKWAKNGEGELFDGTYNQANDDGTGTILGVTYPVALTQETLDSLGDNNYNFTALDTVPVAYKIVTVVDDEVSFSAVQDAEPTVLSGLDVEISTNTAWGDYLLTADGTPDDMGAILGWILKTDSGESYAMRHEENIWRGELAWSTGFVTNEPHGNTLSYENFVGIMGDTITEMVIITENGYYTAETSVYVPIKFGGSVEVADTDIKSGSTSVTIADFPDDYQMNYSVDGLESSVSDGTMTFSDALAGAYTLTVSDVSGVYADVTASFTLTTDSMPAKFNGTDKLVKADDATDEEFANFIANLSKASVNGTEYSISGRKSVKMILEDGTIDFTVASGGNNVFDGSGNYTMSITASGYNNPLEFTITSDTNSSDDNNNSSDTTTATTTTAKTTTAKTTTAKTTTAKTTTNAANSTESPKTGVAGVAVPTALLAVASVTFVVSRKKKQS